jgi:hypothetical protein
LLVIQHTLVHQHRRQGGGIGFGDGEAGVLALRLVLKRSQIALVNPLTPVQDHDAIGVGVVQRIAPVAWLAR